MTDSYATLDVTWSGDGDATPRWSGWIDWYGGDCPIPWAEEEEWGSQWRTGGPADKSGIREVEPSAVSEISSAYWTWNEERIYRCLAYRYRLDLAPDGFIAPNGSFVDCDGQTSFYTVTSNPTGKTVTVLTDRTLSLHGIATARAAVDGVNEVRSQNQDATAVEEPRRWSVHDTARLLNAGSEKSGETGDRKQPTSAALDVFLDYVATRADAIKSAEYSSDAGGETILITFAPPPPKGGAA